jgi:two-component system nitrogen regulation sensor histidine kinase NtrY
MTTLLIGISGMIQVVFLIKYIEKSNREIIKYLEGLKYSDVVLNHLSVTGKSFNEISDLIREINSKIKTSQIEKEKQFRYLGFIIEHLEVGLISFFDNGDVDLCNLAAKKILKTPVLKNVRQLRRLNPDLPDLLMKMESGKRDLVKAHIEEDILNLMVHIKKFKLSEKSYILAAFYNIQKELDDKEIDSWQNLIKVLTHEIMNSVAPIVSLAATATDLAESANLKTRETDSKADKKINALRDALQTIEKRGQGLLHFINNYRNLMRIPNPVFQPTAIALLFDRVCKLMQDKFNKEKIKFAHSINPETLNITCDPGLMEQVLINLLLNAIRAVKDKPKPSIKLKAYMDKYGHTVIDLIDNGIGIPDELIKAIFIPFFTTKRDGSGIGLSISKQIMRLHKGTISVRSEINKGSTFRLRF